MPIDRDQLLEDLHDNLLPGNPLTDEEILVIVELIIAQVGDDEANYGEVFCKTLDAIIKKIIRILKSTTGIGAKKREKTDEVEVEWHNSKTTSLDGWEDLRKDLVNICPLYGYNPRRAVGLKINLGKELDPCPCTTKYKDLI